MSTLHDKREKLRLGLHRQRARLKRTFKKIVRKSRGVALPVLRRLREPATRQAGLQLVVTVVPFLLRRDPRARLIFDVALPLALRYGPRLAAGVQAQAGELRRSVVLGRLKENVLEMRKRLWRKKRVWPEEAYPETMCFV
jgi:hypothetical protein